MTKPAFFVDGQTEQKIIQTICPNIPVQRINCNGDCVELSAIARRVASLVTVLNNKYYPIIIIIDRESRKEKFSDISEKLTDEIKSLGINNDIIVNVADRMFENWILADIESLKKNRKISASKLKATYENTNGKAQLKKLLETYHETTDGVELFLSSNPKTIKKNSESFNRFVENVNKINCKWLKNKL